jgi:hypothetical protein
MMSILWDRHIRPVSEPHGAGREIPGLEDRHRPACFSETPLHLLQPLVEFRSDFGVGFSQDFLLSKGGGRVWYLEDEGVLAGSVKKLVAEAADGPVDPADPLWTLTPFIDFPVPGSLEDWRWEREWRVPGGLRFLPADVAFLFIPEKLHEKARQFFSDHEFADTGPAYLCPYIDPHWTRPRIEAALGDARERLPPSRAAIAERMDF